LGQESRLVLYYITVGGLQRMLSTDAGRRECPFCESHAIRRSHNAGLFDALFVRLMLMRPFRCMECEERFYGFFFRKSALKKQQARPKPARHEPEPSLGR
jgi:hypothetical protein